MSGGITMFANLVDFAKFRWGEYPRFPHASSQFGPRDISHLPVESEGEVNQPFVRGSVSFGIDQGHEARAVEFRPAPDCRAMEKLFTLHLPHRRRYGEQPNNSGFPRN